jgi:hypothetical protein
MKRHWTWERIGLVAGTVVVLGSLVATLAGGFDAAAEIIPPSGRAFAQLSDDFKQFRQDWMKQQQKNDNATIGSTLRGCQYARDIYADQERRNVAGATEKRKNADDCIDQQIKTLGGG